LAQDDFILASRIAQGEALYLRRERPPAEPAPGRWILLDTGLRLWGIPRIRALATALAVVSITAARNACRVFAPCQGDLEALTLSDPEGLLRALSLLNTHLSPEPYLHQIGSCIDGQKGDFVFITHRAVAPTSLECLPALARPDLTCYVITVDASDLIECSVITRSGTFLRQSIEQQLELIYDAAAAHPLFCGEPSEALT
jgi:hypothetical protein